MACDRAASVPTFDFIILGVEVMVSSARLELPYECRAGKSPVWRLLASISAWNMLHRPLRVTDLLTRRHRLSGRTIKEPPDRRRSPGDHNRTWLRRHDGGAESG